MTIPGTEPHSTETLTELKQHFAFGDNWKSFAKTVDDRHLQAACDGLLDLFDADTLLDATVLDIGCGSGLHAVAAAKLGAKVLAVDLDPMCIKTTKLLVEKFGVEDSVEVRELSVLDLPNANLPKFDVVYSWGVLHHTGAMWDAIGCGADRVRSGGLYAIAIYRRPLLCPAWKVEKRIYKSLPRLAQQVVKHTFLTVSDCGLLLKGRMPHRYRREYYARRGMTVGHDAHDWLGGYPYESALQRELEDADALCDFKLINTKNARGGKLELAILGSGCGQYVFLNESSST
jgi:2-polyprenyl-3-methyl-5-hydroxy-6-metoxy-1,4-benzoquinol methylase